MDVTAGKIRFPILINSFSKAVIEAPRVNSMSSHLIQFKFQQNGVYPKSYNIQNGPKF